MLNTTDPTRGSFGIRLVNARQNNKFSINHRNKKLSLKTIQEQCVLKKVKNSMKNVKNTWKFSKLIKNR